MTKKTVYAVGLGCPKNEVDTQYLLGGLAAAGYQVADAPEGASLLLVNTCAFIQPAVEEAIGVILELAEDKQPGQMLVVAGCLNERYGPELADELPEVDLFLSSARVDRLVRLIEAGGRPGRGLARPAGYLPGPASRRLLTGPRHRAYLKIAEGCSNACAYCVIPRLKGPFRSRPLADILAEARMLTANGARELTLVAQDTTRWGADLGPGNDLAALLAALNREAGAAWLRVMYAYPERVTPRLIEAMAAGATICRYLDLPIQHASPGLLAAMGRPHKTDLAGLVARLRAALPGISLRTTVMVGFPGESEEDFERLLAFIAQARFEHLGCFAFSPEEGAAAASFPGQVAPEEKEERLARVMELQTAISLEKNQALVGQTLTVLVEGFHEETELLLTGRTQGQAPEIDGAVLITAGWAEPGTLAQVAVEEAFEYDVAGRIIGVCGA